MSFLKVAVALAVALVTSLAMAAEPWRYEDKTEKMSGKTARYATLLSDNSLDLKFPYSGVNHGTIMVRQHPKHGLDVLVYLQKGQVTCRSYEGCTIRARFGDGQPVSFKGTRSSDGSTETVFLSPAKKFIELAKKNKKILVELELYQSGVNVLEFNGLMALDWK